MEYLDQTMSINHWSQILKYIGYEHNWLTVEFVLTHRKKE